MEKQRGVPMEVEKREVHFDSDLRIEAYHFQGIMQKFPNHFHEHYVIGFVESGRRFLTCKNREYTIDAGDLLLFNPLDPHACQQVDEKALDWRCLNIEKDVMSRIAQEITGDASPPIFTTTVAVGSDAVPVLRELHGSIMSEAKDFTKEENLYFLMEQLVAEYAQPTAEVPPRSGREILAACDYMEAHYAQSITLADLSRVCGLNKYTLLRSFTLQKGITPYQYLSTIRINRAKMLLAAGVSPIEASIRSGFSDQSHFTRFFKTFIGLTPKLYQNLFRKDAEQPEIEVPL
jgi:AraC-like DNA-binding protein/mannose-6-phosphate isomerase-like protein (cupin superfamily)